MHLQELKGDILGYLYNFLKFYVIDYIFSLAFYSNLFKKMK